MMKIKSMGSKLIIMLMLTFLFASMTFTASAHSLTPWSKAYSYYNAGNNHQFAIGDCYHIDGRIFNYCWKNNTIKSKFNFALLQGATLWDGMINIIETDESEAHAIINYDPEKCNELKMKAYVDMYPKSNDHYGSSTIVTQLVIGDISNNDLEDNASTMAHELGHLWGIIDLYEAPNGGDGKTTLESIYSNTHFIDKPTTHDKNAMFICIDQPWFTDTNGKVKYQKSVSESGVVTWAKNETYNGYTFDSDGYLTNTAKITYDANGGLEAPQAQYKVPGFGLRLSSGVDYHDGKYYTITIDLNDGTPESQNTEKVYCVISGWNTDPNGDGTQYELEQVYTYSNSNTLYAQWKDPTSSNSEWLSKKPERAGYRFHNWNTDPDGKGLYITEIENYTFTQDTTVYALWLDNEYTIHYDANGGTVSPETRTVMGDASTILPTPTKEYVLTYDANGGSVSATGKGINCPLNGWYTAATGGEKLGNAGESYQPCNDESLNQTLYAQWGNATAGTLEIPTRDGYVFTGWYTAPTGGTQVTSATTITADMTIYAHWGPVDGLYSLKNDNSGQYLDIADLGNGAACIQRPSDQVTNQIWKVTHLGNGEYELRPLRCLSGAMGLGNTGNVNGATVGVWNTSSYPTYRWKIVLNEDGSWNLMSQASGYTKSLSIAEGSTSTGAACIQQTVTGAASEKWEMEPVNALPANAFVSGTLNAGAEEWYSFRPSVSGEYTFITANATKSINGTLIGENFSEICDKNHMGNDFRTTSYLNANTTYYIKIQGVDPSEYGTFDIGVFCGTSVINISDLDAIRNNPSGDYFLMADINFTGSDINWEPIASFSGTFNGNGYTIRGLSVNRPSQNNVGLFGALSGSINNLTLESIQIIGGNNTGGLAGSTTASSTINNCHIIGNSSVSGGTYTGGLVGLNWAAITNSSTTCAVHATGNFAGGLLGDSYGDITGCFATGSVTATNYAGGLVGDNRGEGSIIYCYATGDVNGINRTGGLVGNNDSYINMSYATGNVVGGFNVGGFVGRHEYGDITNSYSTGSVEVLYDYGGGFVGYANYGDIQRCYSLSNVIGSSTKFMGGFLGYGNTAYLYIENCFACATVQPSSNSAGFAGYSNGTIRNCYTVSNNATGFIKGGEATVTNCYFSSVYGGTDAKATAKTPAEMLTLATYNGWNFSSIWEMDGASSYPTLQGITTPNSFQNIGSTFTVDGLIYKITSPMTVQVGTGTSTISVSGSIVIPSAVLNGTETYTVTGIGTNAFRGSSLTSVTIPATVVSIETSAFQSCRLLTNVTFEEGSRLKTIGNHAFNGCSSLTGITIPATVISIGNNAFQSCTGLTSITFATGSKLQSIGNHAFNSCSSLTSITIPATVTSIGNNAFQSCTGMTDVTFATGSNLQGIGNHTFNGCTSLTSVAIPDSVTSIGNNAFTGCTALVSVSFGTESQLDSIGSYAFYNCINLESINLPLSLRSIGGYAFTFCKELTSVFVPYGVTSLPTKVFYGCNNLNSVSIPISVTSIASDTFIGCNDITLYVVSGSYAHTYAINNNLNFEV